MLRTRTRRGGMRKVGMITQAGRAEQAQIAGEPWAREIMAAGPMLHMRWLAACSRSRDSFAKVAVVDAR